MYPKAYIDYLVYFHGERDYFECHEVLEEYWKERPAPQRKKVWVGLIQIAVALYHQRRKNFQGARKMMRGAVRILKREQEELTRLGLDDDALLEALQSRLHSIQQEKSYTSIDLPISDPKLMQACKRQCEEKGYDWGSKSDLNDHELIHKHTLRDRRDVVDERARQLENRRRNRKSRQ